MSPVKADREAIARLERETGRDIQAIIQDLDSSDLVLNALEEKTTHSLKTRLISSLRSRVGSASFLASLAGIVALFSLQPERWQVAIALGFVLGLSLPKLRR